MLHLTKETHAFTKAIQQREMGFRTHDREWNARQSRSGADIDKPFTLQIRCHHNAIENMAYQHLIRIANRSQVVRFIPFMQHIHVGNKLVFLVIGKRNTCVFQQ
ncbi:hypothetical protein HmCmsJML025_01313 [Escherichia coli]|nr:hypothetical protein HmCmsJML025_01313 [Escherichia coli]